MKSEKAPLKLAELFLQNCEEDIPLLADLAATYSSKS